MQEITKVLGPTVTTGIAEIDLGGAGARLESPVNGSILAIKIEMATNGVVVTTQSATAIIRLKSNTIPVVPFEAFAQPLNAGTGAEITTSKAESKWIPVNAPVVEGDKLQITIAEGVAVTNHVVVSVSVMFADYQTGPQYHSQIGTLTAVGAAAGEARMAGGIVIDGGAWIKKVIGMMYTVTDASGLGAQAKYRLSSTQFKHLKSPGLPDLPGMGDIEFNATFLPSFLSAGTTADSVANRLAEVDYPHGVPINPHCPIDVYCNAFAAFTAAGSYNVQIVYY